MTKTLECCRAARGAKVEGHEEVSYEWMTTTGAGPLLHGCENGVQRANAALQQRCLDLTAALAAAQTRQGQLVQRLVRASQALTASTPSFQGLPALSTSSPSSGPTVPGP